MGLIKTAAKVAVASSVHGRVQRRQQQRWAAQDQATAMQATQPGVLAHPAVQPGVMAQSAAVPAVATPPPGPPTPQASAPLSTADKIAQLKSLGELRDAGVLTDLEFENEKSKLLNG
ncbi:MAG: SHOCT domain-containing protein [Solirubrobacterales bacterium]|nr:SHOCT domain-containing protein [Solirubrobacterales bacterium]MBV9801501.1 SHOCT domain-containing protein [Solirubrobacterales bacterium]